MKHITSGESQGVKSLSSPFHNLKIPSQLRLVFMVNPRTIIPSKRLQRQEGILRVTKAILLLACPSFGESIPVLYLPFLPIGGTGKTFCARPDDETKRSSRARPDDFLRAYIDSFLDTKWPD
jgi:hypothetical protein